MSTTVVILTVGGTADPIVKAVEEVKDEAAVVLLLYGRPFPGQKPSPFDVAAEAQQKCEALGIPVETREVADPEDIDVCLAEARRIFSESKVVEAERVIVNFTGGTKALSAAVVHAALTAELSGRLELDYTGGGMRDEYGRVVREAMRVVRSERTATEERLQQALQNARRSSYREARFLCRTLPDRGRAEFVKQAIEALWHWDEFDYEAANQIIQRLQGPARTLEDNELLAPLARVLIRMGEPSRRLARLLPKLRNAQNGQPFEGAAQEDLLLLVADVLENSRRRLEEGRNTDSVLRAYRAVESAVQAQLLDRGINPWHPRWDDLSESVRRRFLELLNATREPRNLTLSTGLALLEALGQSLDPDMRKRLEDIQQARNFSYLEHGYLHLDQQRAERVHQYAGQVCEAILAASLDDQRAKVGHQWE
ncbi:MAG: TIGR02710 family CRISPR-associated CARF protein [Blastocatellia bacterium]|nr:TIGR02710 family CRISPR-associated CARF protein [Blastocatellia bacterium]MCS7158671.1 TIGR02710 family CRISPR-associated CARF protein [Blastocatellia bacterium]